MRAPQNFFCEFWGALRAKCWKSAIYNAKKSCTNRLHLWERAVVWVLLAATTNQQQQMEFKLKYKQAGCDMVEVFRIFGKFTRIETWSSLGCKELAVQYNSYSVETEKAREVYAELVKEFHAVRI